MEERKEKEGKMVLHLIGLGLGDEKDVTMKGLEAIRKCSKVYLEHYTSLLGVGKERLVPAFSSLIVFLLDGANLVGLAQESFYEREVILADREMVESEAEALFIEPARNEDIAVLVVGDPFGCVSSPCSVVSNGRFIRGHSATTHSDLVLRAKQAGVEVKVVHNASIMNAVAACGLQLYLFGHTVSMVFFEENWRPDSWYEKIAANRKMGLHTLCLLGKKRQLEVIRMKLMH